MGEFRCANTLSFSLSSSAWLLLSFVVVLMGQAPNSIDGITMIRSKGAGGRAKAQVLNHSFSTVVVALIMRTVIYLHLGGPIV
jgi:hypothetical protein